MMSPKIVKDNLNQWFSTFLAHGPSFSNHSAMLTLHEELVEHVLRKVTIFRKILSKIYGTHCGTQEMLRITGLSVLKLILHYKVYFLQQKTTLEYVWKLLRLQARRQDIAAGGAKTRRRGQKTERGLHFKNTVWDVCSNQGANREMGGTDFKWGAAHHWAPRWRWPCATAISVQCLFAFLHSKFTEKAFLGNLVSVHPTIDYYILMKYIHKQKIKLWKPKVLAVVCW